MLKCKKYRPFISYELDGAISEKKKKQWGWRSRLFKSSEFGNGSRMSDEKRTILEFKDLQNKKWYKQAVKSTRTRKSYRTY